MKSILIAATIVGAVGAGVILYLRGRSNSTGNSPVKDAASDAYRALNSGIGTSERLAQHAMG